MKRRRQLTVWPAIADLMTVLAVSGLFGSLALLPQAGSKADILQALRKAERTVQELQEALDAARQNLQEQKAAFDREREDLQSEIREAVRNQKMFEAIQRAQQEVNRISESTTLQFEDDQTLRFGDDLVHFEPNSLEPTWEPAGRKKLRRFCEEISRRLAGRTSDGTPLQDLFIVQVEGHTDTTQCPDDPNCNWWISAGRAAVFVALMRQGQYCPQGGRLQLRPVGYADTRPPYGNLHASRKDRRRISVRIVPNYRKIIG